MDQGTSSACGLTIDQFRVRVEQIIGIATINPVIVENFAVVLEILPGFDFGGATGIRMNLKCWTGTKCEWIIEIAKGDFIHIPHEPVYATKVDRFLLEARDESVKKFKLRFARLKTKDRKITSDESTLEALNLNALTAEASRIVYDGLSVARKPVFPRHEDFQPFEVPSALAATYGISHRGHPERCSEHDRERAKVKGRLLKPDIGQFVFHLGPSDSKGASLPPGIAGSPELMPVDIKPMGLIAETAIDLMRDDSEEPPQVKRETTLQNTNVQLPDLLTPTPRLTPTSNIEDLTGSTITVLELDESEIRRKYWENRAAAAEAQRRFQELDAANIGRGEDEMNGFKAVEPVNSARQAQA